MDGSHESVNSLMAQPHLNILITIVIIPHINTYAKFINDLNPTQTTQKRSENIKILLKAFGQCRLHYTLSACIRGTPASNSSIKCTLHKSSFTALTFRFMIALSLC